MALGEFDSAIATLRGAAGHRCPWFLQLLADPRLKPLSGHPEFQELQDIQTRMESVLSITPEWELPLVPTA